MGDFCLPTSLEVVFPKVIVVLVRSLATSCFKGSVIIFDDLDNIRVGY